jgi:hypothetical protein
MGAEVFISYSRRDSAEVQRIAHHLESNGVSVWVDTDEIEGGTNYGLKISRGIQSCKVLMLMCSNAAMQSRNVKQEIQLAWRYERPYVPLLLEPINFPEQVEYWLEGWQWIEVLGASPERWLPKVMRSLSQLEVRHANGDEGRKSGEGARPSQETAQTKGQPGESSPRPSNAQSPTHMIPSSNIARPAGGLAGLREVARFTDRIWPLPAGKVLKSAPAHETFRGLGAPQDHARHAHRIGSDVCLAIETSRDGYLTLLDEGPEALVYSLCPSWFAPSTFLPKGRHYLPQPDSTYEAFRITGSPGREQLLAIISDQPLDMNWMPADPNAPARVLDGSDIESLLSKLRSTDPSSWIALATYFDIVS